MYRVNPPQPFNWPPELPVSETLTIFFSICDGGYIGDFQWFRLNELAFETTHWLERLAGYSQDRSSPLIRGQHVVPGTDPAGAPLMWDSQTDLVATFWFKGGGWEPIGGLDSFLQELFSPTNPEDHWFQALAQLHLIASDQINSPSS